MFEQTFVDGGESSITPWAVAASLLVQCLLVIASVLAPLIYTYDLPVADWVRDAVVLVPPPPPAPAAAAAAEVVPAAKPPNRFEQFVEAPSRIPEKVVPISTALAAGLTAPNLSGLAGGSATGVANGVMGVVSPAVTIPEAPLRVGGQIQAARLIRRVNPVYPPEAVEDFIQGPVVLEAVINTAGEIRDIKVVSGHPLLAEAALEAVEQWRYHPTMLNGRYVEVITQIRVTFSLKATPPPPPPEGQKTNGRKNP